MEYYAFDEPVLGLAESGSNFTACQTIIMSGQDAIGYWRATHPELKGLSDDLVLSEFVTINHAYKVYPVHKLED